MAKRKQEELNLSVLEALEAKYGVGTSSVKNLRIVSTGSLQLNQAMKIGGTAVGKMVEIYGPMSCGKSTLMLHQIAEYQKAFPNKVVALFDFEYSYDPDYAAAIGVDTDKLRHYQLTTQEEGYNMILELIEKDLVSCVVIDSQSAAPPKAVLEGEMGDSTIALQARNNSKFCLKVKNKDKEEIYDLEIEDNHNLFTNNLLSHNSMGGDPTITTGGKAIKFYADVIWKVWKTNDKPNELNKTTVDVIKSKIGKPYGQAKFNILWGTGVDKLGEIIDYAEEFGIIKKSGSWYAYGDSKIGQGMNGVRVIMRDNPELLEEITDKVMDRIIDQKVEVSSEIEITEEKEY
jgi:recombination protein RecA